MTMSFAAQCLSALRVRETSLSLVGAPAVFPSRLQSRPDHSVASEFDDACDCDSLLCALHDWCCKKMKETDRERTLLK